MEVSRARSLGELEGKETQYRGKFAGAGQGADGEEGDYDGQGGAPYLDTRQAVRNCFEKESWLMSNESLLERMQGMLSCFESGALSPYALERDFETCMQGMERIGSLDIETSRQLIGRLVIAHFIEDETEFGDPENAAAVLGELRHFLAKLPQ